MKLPEVTSIIRHGESAYNILKGKKAADPEYREFRKLFEEDIASFRKLSPADQVEADFASPRTKALARLMSVKYALDTSDYETDLSPAGEEQAFITGRSINIIPEFRSPDVILVSPYKRTRRTLDLILKGAGTDWDAKIVIDDRIREQEHGISTDYSDWRIFHVFNPAQMRHREKAGPYWYQYPQGESVSQVRERIRSITTTLVREYAEQRVMMVSHHLTKLAFRSIHERLSPEQFIHLDENEKPVNCGVTIYHGNPDLGRNGKLELKVYNRKLY